MHPAAKSFASSFLPLFTAVTLFAIQTVAADIQTRNVESFKIIAPQLGAAQGSGKAVTCPAASTTVTEMMCPNEFNVPSACYASCGYPFDALCPTTDDANYIADCICKNSVIFAYAACLQCLLNDHQSSSVSGLQELITDTLQDNCAGHNQGLSTPHLTSAPPIPTPTFSFTSDPFTFTNTFTDDEPSFPTITGPFSGGDDDGGDNEEFGSSSGLSTGAIIGIAVAIPLGTALIFGLVGLIFASHAKSRRRNMIGPYYTAIPQTGHVGYS